MIPAPAPVRTGGSTNAPDASAGSQWCEEDLEKVKQFKCEACASELDRVSFEVQEGFCTDCMLEGPAKSAAQVRQVVLHTEPAFPNKTVNEIRNINIDSADHLQKIVECLFEMVVRDAVDSREEEGHVELYSRCGQTYADVMFSLRLVVPTFPVANDTPKTFTRILLNVTQEKFEEMVKKFAAPAESEEINSQVFSQLIALVSFIGHLYVRKLVAARVVAQVVHDLVGVRDRFPAVQLIQSVVELMYIIGKTIDGNAQGKMLMTQFMARLKHLAGAKKNEEDFLYPQDVQSLVRALSHARKNIENWPARPNTQVVVAYSEVTLQQAEVYWYVLKAEKKLSPEQMQLVRPQGNAVDSGVHILIRSKMSGTVLGVICNVQEQAVLPDAISGALSIHAARLQIFAEGSEELLLELPPHLEDDLSSSTA